MTTPTGQISMSDIMTELGISGATSLNDSDVRGLAGISSGQISFDDLRGKSASILTPFNYGTITSTHGAQSGTTVIITVNTNGNITTNAVSGGGTQTWNSGGGSSSDYEVYCQYNSGYSLNYGEAVNTWITLSANRSFGISSGGSTPARQGNYTLKIRKKSNTSDEISDTFNLKTQPL